MTSLSSRLPTLSLRGLLLTSIAATAVIAATGARAADYNLPSGKLTGQIVDVTLFTLSGTGEVTATGKLSGAIGSTAIQSGGKMGGEIWGLTSYTQSGGSISGSVSTITYSLTDIAATSKGGTINASRLFDLNVALTTLPTIVEARLTGTGKLVKSGDGLVRLSNLTNDFTGAVLIDRGILSINGDALPDVAVTVAEGASLQFSTNKTIDTIFLGAINGEGDLVKRSNGTLTLGGGVHLNHLGIEAGWVNIGTGTTTNIASFDSALVSAGTTLRVAPNATLEIRTPNNLVNYGMLINDGTIIDDLDNFHTFFNNQTNDADVASNTGTITNTAPGVWTGDIKTNAGTISNQGGGEWNGNIKTNAGTIWNSQGIWNGDVENNSAYIHNTGVGSIWTGDVILNSLYLNNFLGAQWHGDVYDNAAGAKIGTDAAWTGQLFDNHGMIDQTDIWTGDVWANHGTVWNHDDGSWLGDVRTNAGLINNVNIWTGSVIANAGTITNTGIWTGNFTSAGTVNARNQINGTFTNFGALNITGNLTGVTVLTSPGVIDMRGGGATNTFSVASAVFGPGSSFGIDLDTVGGSDKLVVTGAAALDGTVRIAGATPSQTYQDLTDYTILTAGSIGGSFDGVTEDLSFFDARLRQNLTSVTLTLQRNDRGFVTIGTNDNQRAAAAAVTALGAGNPLYDSVLWLTDAEAADAFADLSGESQASVETSAILGATLVGDVTMGRVEQSFAALGEVEPSGYAPAMLLPGTGGTTAVWGQAYGARSTLATGDAMMDSITGGLAGGIDGMLGDWRLGLMMQVGQSAASVAARNATVGSTDYGVGVYGGTEWGNTQVSLGGSLGLHDNQSTRQIVLPGLTNTLSAQYASVTAQVFGRASHEFDLGAVSLTPFADLSYVANATAAYSETGGAASLSNSANVVDATFAALGVDIDKQFVLDEDVLLTAMASAGWRRAFADNSSVTHTLTGGGSFSVTGAPVPTDVFSLGAGFTVDMPANSVIDFAYDAQFGSGIQSHAVKGTYANQF